MHKTSGLVLMLTASVLLVGCGPKADVSTPSANPAPKDPASVSASPEVTTEIASPDEIRTDEAGNMMHVIEGNNSVGIDLNGTAFFSDGHTETIDRNITGQIKESIRDSQLNNLQKLPEDQRDCTADSYRIIVPSLSTDEYQSCDYDLQNTDPLFHVAELILGQYSRE